MIMLKLRKLIIPPGLDIMKPVDVIKKEATGNHPFNFFIWKLAVFIVLIPFYDASAPIYG